MTDAERKALIPGERVMVKFADGAGRPWPETVLSRPWQDESQRWFVELAYVGTVTFDEIYGYAEPTQIVFEVGEDGYHSCPFKDQRAVLERHRFTFRYWPFPPGALVNELSQAGYRVVFEPSKKTPV
jgi:hypothetical protein